MIVVGITGKYCAGKDTASALLVESGYQPIDVDQLGHRALEVQKDFVVRAFGSGILSPDGQIDRKALGQRVFASPGELTRLESIVHPTMIDMVTTEINRHQGSDPPPVGVVINAAILFRMGLDRLCGQVLYVTAPFLTRVVRARARDAASLRQVIRRLRSQTDVDPQFSTSDAEIHTVRNDGNREQLLRRIRRHLPLAEADGAQWSNTEPFSS